MRQRRVCAAEEGECGGGVGRLMDRRSTQSPCGAGHPIRSHDTGRDECSGVQRAWCGADTRGEWGLLWRHSAIGLTVSFGAFFAVEGE